MAGRRPLLLGLVALVEFVGHDFDFRLQHCRVHLRREVGDEDAVDHVADRCPEVGRRIAGTDADERRNIEVELLGLSLEQNGVVRKRDRDQNIGRDILQLLHDRGHIGGELIVALVVNELDTFLARISADAITYRLAEGAILPKQRDPQIPGRLLEPIGQVVDNEIDGGLSVFARRSPDLEGVLETAARDDFRRSGRFPVEDAVTFGRLTYRNGKRRRERAGRDLDSVIGDQALGFADRGVG